MAKSENNAVIQTMGLTKVFRDFWGRQRVMAVDKLDLEVRQHEVFGLLGPNGSGKSTTIKMLLGLLNPSQGWAKVLGKAPGDVKTNASIGYLPEESFLYPFLNARETLDFYGRLFGLSAEQRNTRITSLLDMVGLSATASRPVGEFSKGMQRRVGLAQALINDPKILILDEPTSGMDPIGTRQIKDLIIELGKRGKTILLSSHLMADIEDVCDRICILYGGKIRAQGTMDELLARTEMTRIESPQLDEEVINEIKAVISRRHPDYELSFETPRDRMEDFFLHTVEQAQKSDVATSGARMGGKLSDFLASNEEISQSEQVIDKLVQVEAIPQAEEPSVTESVEPVAARANDEIISSLTSSEKKELTTKVDDSDIDPADSSKEVNTNVIDGLLGKKDKTDE